LKRALALVALIAIVCIVLLFVLLRQFESYTSPPPPPRSAPAGPADHYGSVVFDDGAPAEVATVTIVWDAVDGPAFAEEPAGRGGYFSVPDAALASGRVREFTARAGPLSVRGGDAWDRDMPTLRLPPTFRLAGRVQSGVAGEAVAAAVGGARLRCAGVETLSDERGAFALEGVPAAAWREADLAISVEAAGYQPLAWELPRDELPPYYGDLTLRLRPAR
jgi:hypothetical protein